MSGGLDPRHVLELVVRPTLLHLDLHSESAEQLLMGTAAQESGFACLRQWGGGPALGLWQCEPATYRDLTDNYLAYRLGLWRKVRDLASSAADRPMPDPMELCWNLGLACAVARVHYLRVRDPLPQPGDVAGMASYYKQHYNTRLGAATESDFERAYTAYVSPLYRGI